MSWDGTERRADKRYAPPDATARFRRAGVLAFFGPMSEPCVLLNLSDRGLAFMVQQSFAEGEKLQLRVEAPGLGGAFTCKARVVWTQKSETEAVWRVGICVASIADADAARQRHMLDKCILERSEMSTSLFLKKVKRL